MVSVYQKTRIGSAIKFFPQNKKIKDN